MSDRRPLPFATSHLHQLDSTSPIRRRSSLASASRTATGSAPSALDREAMGHDEGCDVDGDEAVVEGQHSRQASFPTTSAAAPALASILQNDGYFLPRPRPSKSGHASPQVTTSYTPPPPAGREWSYGSAWSWQSAVKTSSSCRHVVTGAGGQGTAAPLVGLAKCPDLAGRFVAAGKTTLKILQVATVETASPNQPGRIEVQNIDEIKEQSRLGKSYGITDVRWGYGLTHRKVVTGCANGCVVLWDLEASQKQSQTKYEHTRAVNRLAVGGQSGLWVISASQDEYLRLWDVRADQSAFISFRMPNDAPRDLACHPSLSMPDLCYVTTVHDSGTLYRWDLRKIANPIDRVLAHPGGALCMAWKASAYQSSFAGDGGHIEADNSTSWIATAGQDRTVKIWKVGKEGLATKPTHTLFPSMPVNRIAWRPGFPAELATVSLPAIGQSGAPNHDTDGDMGRAASAEVEIWDVRRPHLSKWALRHPLDGPATSLIFPDATSLWTSHRATSTFIQHDIEHDAVRQDAELPRCALGWTIEGELALAPSARGRDFTDAADAPPAEIDGSPYMMEQELATINVRALDFDGPAFRRLAEGYILSEKPFEELCAVNAEVAEENDRLDAAQTWRILARWFGEEAAPVEESCTPPRSPSIVSHPSPVSAKLALTGRRSGKSNFSPTSSPGRLAPQPSRLGLVSQVIPGSLSSAASSQYDEDEESSSAEAPRDRLTSHSSRPSDRPSLSSDETDSEADDIVPSPFLSASILSQSFSAQQQTHSRNSSRSSVATPRANRPAFLSGQQVATMEDITPSMSRITSTSSDSEAEGPYGVRKATHMLKSHRRTVSESIVMLPKVPPPGRSSRSRTRRGPGLALSKAGEKKAAGSSSIVTTPRQMVKQRREDEWEGLREEMRTRLTAALVDVLERYAEEGDVQMCVTVISVMSGKMDFDVAFRSRTTSAYLKLLHRFGLFVTAASVRRCSEDEALRLKSTDSTTIYTACGRCKKALSQVPYGLCKRCSLPAIRCTLCHRAIREYILGICSSCGHGVHRECISAYLRPGGATPHSALPSRSSLATTPATSAPSTPRFFLGHDWFWGADGEVVRPDSEAPTRMPSPRLSHLLPSMPKDLSEALVCPSGCGCRPCAIFALPAVDEVEDV